MVRRSTKSLAPFSNKSHSTALPNVKAADGSVDVSDRVSSIGANKPRPLLQKDIMTIDPGIATIKEDVGKSVDDYNVKQDAETGKQQQQQQTNKHCCDCNLFVALNTEVSALKSGPSSEEIILTFTNVPPSSELATLPLMVAHCHLLTTLWWHSATDNHVMVAHCHLITTLWWHTAT